VCWPDPPPLPSPPCSSLGSQTNGDGYIDYEEYKHMCVVNPSILKPLTINVAEMLKDAKAETAK
jgi:hypothetical protein